MTTKHVFTLSVYLALAVVLTSCQAPPRRTSGRTSSSATTSYTTTSSQLPTLDETQVFNKTEYRTDETRRTKKLIGPMINREGTDWQVEGKCGSALRGWLLSDNSWDFQLYAERYANEPAHFTEAVDEAGQRFTVTQIDIKTNSYYKNGVLDCTETKEIFGIPLSLAYLCEHQNTGIRFKFYGNGPSGSMFIPSYYIKGFLSKIDQMAPAPAMTTTQQTTVRYSAPAPVYNAAPVYVPAPSAQPCYQQQTYVSAPSAPPCYQQTTTYVPAPSAAPPICYQQQQPVYAPADSSYQYVEKPAESYTIKRTVDRYSVDRTTERGLPSTLTPASSSSSSSASSSANYNYNENITPIVVPLP